MSIFDADRIGKSVPCRVVHGSKQRPEAEDVGYVRWTHAKVGQVVGSITTLDRGKLAGPWIVEAVDIPASELIPVIESTWQ